MSTTLERIEAPPRAVVHDLEALRARLDETIPAKQLDRNLFVATWNLRNFGGLTDKWATGPHDTPKRNLADLRAIAEIISRFDVVALQEVRSDLRACRHLLDALGPDWGWILSDVPKTKAANDERLAFLFDTRRVKPSGLAGEFSEPFAPGKEARKALRQFARPPYAVSFLSAGKTFIIVTLHVIYGSDLKARREELETIARKVAGFAREVANWGHNLVVEGDFNIDREGDELYDAFVSTGLTPAEKLNDVPRTIFCRPDDKDGHYYDQIAWFTNERQGPALSLTCTSAGSFDFVPTLIGGMTKEELSFHVSDHYPLWVEFSVREG